MQSSTQSDCYEEEEDAPANTQKPGAFISKAHDAGRMLKNRLKREHHDKTERTSMSLYRLPEDGEFVALPLQTSEALTFLKT